MPRADTSPSPTRKLSPEEAEQVTQRLFYQQQERAKKNEEKRMRSLESNPEMKKPAPIDGDVLETMIKRNYDQQIERKKRTEDIEEKKREDLKASQKYLSETELQDMVQRMYYQRQETTKRAKESLKKKYQPEVHSTKLPKDAVASTADRLGGGAVHTRRQQTRQALFDKYIAPMDPPKRVIDRDAVTAMADRLCTTKR